MKSMKKLVAALLVLTMVLAMSSVAFAASAKFTKEDVEEKEYVLFKGSLYAYNKHSASSKSNIIVKKGSVAQITGVYGKKWVKLRLSNEDKPLEKWFGVDKLTKITDWEKQVWTKSWTWPAIRVIFSSGGSNHSTQDGDPETYTSIKNMTVKTSGKVNLRKTASLSGKSQGTLKKGKRVKLTGKVGYDTCGVAFFQVKYNGKKYYISTAYIEAKYLNKAWDKIAKERDENEEDPGDEDSYSEEEADTAKE